MCVASVKELRFFSVFEEIITPIEYKNVDKEKSDNYHGVKHGVSANHIVEYIVGSTVTAKKEHIVSVGKYVYYKCGKCKSRKNSIRDKNVFLLHACHTRNDYVK